LSITGTTSTGPPPRRSSGAPFDLPPDYAPAHAFSAWYLLTAGPSVEDLRENDRAIQIDRFRSQTTSNLAGICAHRYDRAIV